MTAPKDLSTTQSSSYALAAIAPSCSSTSSTAFASVAARPPAQHRLWTGSIDSRRHPRAGRLLRRSRVGSRGCQRATGRYDRAEVKTAAGDVRLDEVEGDVRVKCVSGDVTLGTVGGGASVNSVSGDATIGSVAGSAVLHSVSGDIELREAEARSGEDDLRRRADRLGDPGPGGAAVRLRRPDARPAHRFQALGQRALDQRQDDVGARGRDEPPANGGPLVELQAKSVSGDIRIVRA